MNGFSAEGLIFDPFLVIVHLTMVSVTTDTTKQYLDPSENLQIVQLHPDEPSIHAIARRFAVSPRIVSRAWQRFQETGSYSRRAGQGHLRSLTHQQERYLLLVVWKNIMGSVKMSMTNPLGSASSNAVVPKV